MKATIHDAARHILDLLGPMRAMKLEKLCYYSQAWHLAWTGQPLFDEPIQAWKNGPIARALWNRHRGYDTVRTWVGEPSNLAVDQQTTIRRVLMFYGQLSGNELSQLSHSETPWREARTGLKPNEAGTQEITQAAMKNYYAGAQTLVSSDNLEEMVSNLVRRASDGSWNWAVNVDHPQMFYIGFAGKLLAPMIVAGGKTR
jgi:uncharacterized phage-associated protein